MSVWRKLGVACGALAAMVAVFTVGKYFLNPYGAQTWDWKARVLGFAVYRMPARSMEPTIPEGTIFWVDIAAPGDREPRAQEIIAFQYPPNPAVHYLMRIVALGDQTIEMRGGAVIVDGKQLVEPYLPASPLVPDRNSSFPPLRVPEGNYFVLGDNRGDSSDSRVWGLVPRDHVIGTYIPQEM